MNLFQNFQSFFLTIILLFPFVNCQNIPNPRYQQTSSLIGNRLYFFGGNISPIVNNNDNADNITNEIWYLDLSGSFNTATPPWNKDVGMPIGYVFSASCVSPIDNSAFLVGGRIFIPNTANINLGSSPVYVFNSNISLWTTPNIIGKIYTFGGTNYTYSNVPSGSYNDMSILNTTSMTWYTLPISANTPLPYFDYTATLLPNGIIVYIGGYKSTPPGSADQYEAVSMNEIQTFNTINYSWSTKNGSGASIGTRIYHSAVLTQYGEIIIYGGSLLNDTLTSATPYIAKLDTSSWMWSIPNVSQINSPQLSYHSATLYRDYMIIAFGNYYIMLLWFYNHSNNDLFIGLGIGAGIILLGVFSVVGFLLYKRKNKNQFIPTPGTY
ncbi:galactose oxidase [Gigaspora margarita]|uniref:Galactose oxidase n=1 Tax=Gigaspora margarita TaxID=4874 RepID=A0A8H4ET19_GIGMA|nr:galactose oxidase [Gigaspora margarita]